MQPTCRIGPGWALVWSCTPDAEIPSAPQFHEKHPGEGASGPDQHSQNVKLLVNVPRSGSATQSDLAFWGGYAYAGHYDGFRVIDISNPEAPVLVATVHCPGAQGDVSVYRNLLFQSVDDFPSARGCDDSQANVDLWEGVRIFDISNPAAPTLLASVATACGSHTNTLVPDPANNRAFVYVSSYPSMFNGDDCDAPHGIISIVTVPLANPAVATVDRYELDDETSSYSTPFGGTFRACHDITVFLEIKRAAASCLSEAQMWDISDPAEPVFLWRFDHADAEIWHSAAFSWNGSVVAFGDEAGGGSEAWCTDPDDNHGRVWFLDVADGKSRGSYKIPRVEEGTCTVHYFNFVPLPKGRKVLVSASYTGGTTIVDVDRILLGASTAEAEVGFYRPEGGNVWSSYWYNGFIYTNDILRGVDVMLLSSELRAGARKLASMNPQTQETLIR